MKQLSSAKINRIKTLRIKGLSIPEISKELNIPKTTVFRHSRTVQIPEKNLSLLISKRGGSLKRKIEVENKANKDGKTLVGKLFSRDKLMFLSALYWAKGNKKDFIFTNTNPDIIKIFVRILRDCLTIKEKEIQVSIRLYEGLDVNKSLSFWSCITGIEKEKFLSYHILNGKKNGKLAYDMCRIRVKKGGWLLKKLMGTNNAVASKI